MTFWTIRKEIERVRPNYSIAASAIQVNEFDLFRIVTKAIQYVFNWTGLLGYENTLK